MNQTLIDEACIIIHSAYVALDRLKDPKDIEAIREMLREVDELLSQVLRT